MPGQAGGFWNASVGVTTFFTKPDSAGWSRGSSHLLSEPHRDPRKWVPLPPSSGQGNGDSASPMCFPRHPTCSRRER